MTSPGVGIMGGTFDPIHYGHLLAAEAVRRRLGLDEVQFIPTGQPWQKPVGVGAVEDRYRMTVLATASNAAFSVSRIELDQPGPTYTADTLQRLRAGIPRETRLYLILGADTALHLPSWKDPGRVLALADLVVVSRPGHDLGGLQAALAEIGPARPHVVPIPDLAISSTDLRARVAAGEPIRYLTPDPVVDYIAERGLYRDAKPAGA